MKKIIICDMDDTLCESCKQISDDMAKLISNLVEKGYRFVIIGGSNIPEIEFQVVSKLKVPLDVLGTSGTKYYKFNGESLEKVYEINLTEEEQGKILSALDQLIKKYELVPETSREDQILMRGSQITLSVLGRNADSEHKKNFDPDKKKRLKWKEELDLLLPEFTITIGGNSSIDVTKKGSNKGAGIKKFAEYNNLNLEDMIFIGDGIFPGGNDYSVVGIINYVKVNKVEETIEILKGFLND